METTAFHTIVYIFRDDKTKKSMSINLTSIISSPYQPNYEGNPRKDEYIKPIMQYKNRPTGADAI